MNNTLSNPNSSSQSPNNSGWDSLSDIQFSGNSQPEDPETQTIFFDNHDPKRANQPLQDEAEKAKRRNRQGAKIINAFHTGNLITEVSDFTTDTARENFYGWLNNHQLTPVEESQFLQTIGTPMFSENGNPEQTLSKLSSAHERGILADMSGRGFDQRDQVNTSDLEAVLDRYPTPIEFQAAEAKFLDGLVSPKKRAEYTQDLEIFKAKFYGKRQEYHEAWQKLEQDAKTYQAALDRRQETPEEYAQKVDEGVYAEYFYPSEDLGYLAPETQEQYRNPDYQPTGPNSTQSSTDNSPQNTTKKGIFGKIFGRKK